MTGGKRKLEKGRAVLHHHGDDVVGAYSLRRIARPTGLFGKEIA
jgi:hypothetical protein